MSVELDTNAYAYGGRDAAYAETTITVGNHPNRALVVFSQWRGGASGLGFTVNGIDCGIILGEARNTGISPNTVTQMSYCVNPPVGTITVRAPNDGHPDPVIGVISLYNVNQSDPIYDYNFLTTQNAVIRTNIAGIPGGMLVAGLERNNIDSDTDVGIIEAYRQDVNSDYDHAAVAGYLPTTDNSNLAVGWDWSSSRYNALASLILRPATTGKRFQIFITG